MFSIRSKRRQRRRMRGAMRRDVEVAKVVEEDAMGSGLWLMRMCVDAQ